MFNEKGLKWYYHLVPQQEKTQPYLLRNEIITSKNLLVCQQTELGRRYAVFTDFIDFSEYASQQNDKNFFEVIRDQPQKPYFDIDLLEAVISRKKAKKYVNMAVDELFKLLTEMTTAKFCIQVFSSHSDTDAENKKISYHIVVDGVFLGGYKQNQLFFKLLMERLPLYVANIFDSSLYKSKQQFRTLFSEKLNSKRPKVPVFDMCLNYNGDKGIPDESISDKQFKIFLFRKSLVTVVSGCEFISLPEPPRKEYQRQDGEINVTEDNISRALEIFTEKTSYSAPFSFLNIVHNDNMTLLVCLKRKRSSMCPICDREHEHENPYLFFWGTELHVAWDCRRSEDGSNYYLGALNPLIPTAITENSSSDKPSRLQTILAMAGKQINKPYFPVVKKK